MENWEEIKKQVIWIIKEKTNVHLNLMIELQKNQEIQSRNLERLKQLVLKLGKTYDDIKTEDIKEYLEEIS